MRRARRTTRNPRTRPPIRSKAGSSTGSGRTRAAAAPRAAKRAEPTQWYEVETVIGLEEYARREIRRRLGKAAQLERDTAEGRFTLRYDGSIRRFDELRTVTAVHRVETFAVPRPRALLGHQNLTRLLGVILAVLDARPAGAFRTFRITAAGAGSGVYSRLRQEIAAATGLEATDDAAHLQIAVRRDASDGGGWQVLIRTSQLPLSARKWRVCDMPGALNATVASVMASLVRPRPSERVLNLCCGSGTLMIERLGLGVAASVTGVDIDPDALECADANLRAVGHRSSASLLQADCADLPFPDGSADTITADLPYGMLGNYGGDIASLYRSALAEAGRVGAANASLVVITTRRRALLDAIESVQCWTVRNTIPVKLPYKRGYITPQIYVMRRGSDSRRRI